MTPSSTGSGSVRVLPAHGLAGAVGESDQGVETQTSGSTRMFLFRKDDRPLLVRVAARESTP